MPPCPRSPKLLNICSVTFTMLISTTTQQTSSCMQIIRYHVASFRTDHFQSTPCPAVSYFLDFEKIHVEKTNYLVLYSRWLCYCTVLLCFDYSIIFSNDQFSSFENSTKFKIKMSKLIVQLYKLSRAASRTARRCDILVLFVARCTLVISGAMQSG